MIKQIDAVGGEVGIGDQLQALTAEDGLETAPHQAVVDLSGAGRVVEIAQVEFGEGRELTHHGVHAPDRRDALGPAARIEDDLDRMVADGAAKGLQPVFTQVVEPLAG